MKKVALLLFLALLGPTAAGSQPDTLVITAKALHDERAFVRSIVISVPGIDPVKHGNPRYRLADDTAFAGRTFDDNGWQPLDSMVAADFVRTSVYWVRFDLRVDPELARTSVDLDLFTQGAMEVYFNGELVEHFGTMPITGTNEGYQAAPFVPRRQVRLRFAGDGQRETIALRCVHDPMFLASYERANKLALTLHLPEVNGTIERMEDSTLLQYGLFVGINLIILLLAGVIMSRSERDRSWLMLALFSLFMALVGFTNIPPKGDFGLSLSAVSGISLLNPVVYPLALFFLVGVMRALFATVDRRSMLVFGSITLLMSIASFEAYLDPMGASNLDAWITILYFFEVARQALRAVRKQVHGSWIIGIGAVLFITNGVFLEQYYQYTGDEMARWLRTFLRFSYYLTMPVTIAIFLAVRSAHQSRLLARQRDELDKEVHERTAELRHEKERSDQLLLNILPHEVAEELKDTGAAAAKHFAQATILFTDFKGFTEASEKLSPQELVEELNTCFKAFDHIITARGIEKIKTIGDAYMCAGGLPDPKTSSPADVVHAALEMQAFMTSRKTERDALGLPAFEMRVGIHTGPVVAGIVGVKKFQYDIWGDTVNTASRMESSGEVGQVNISEATYALVKDVVEVNGEWELVNGTSVNGTPHSPFTNDRSPAFTFTPRGKVQAKGKGEMDMYFADNA
ncbi:MAG: adenylate/guanylate cyclase domain-containing protein [Flavobacteriales bacterium]